MYIRMPRAPVWTKKASTISHVDEFRITSGRNSHPNRIESDQLLSAESRRHLHAACGHRYSDHVVRERHLGGVGGSTIVPTVVHRYRTYAEL